VRLLLQTTSDGYYCTVIESMQPVGARGTRRIATETSSSRVDNFYMRFTKVVTVGIEQKQAVSLTNFLLVYSMTPLESDERAVVIDDIVQRSAEEYFTVGQFAIPGVEYTMSSMAYIIPVDYRYV
jgi:hypothetical protein